MNLHADAPKWERHPADVARLVTSATVTVVMLVVAQLFSASMRRFSGDLVQLVNNIPDGVTFALVGLVQITVTIAIPCGVAWLLWRRKVWILVLTSVAGAAGAVMMVLLGQLLDSELPANLVRSRQVDSWLSGSAYPSASLLAAGAAIITAMSPMLARSWRRIAWVSLGVVAFLRVLTATELPINLILILAVGTCMGSLALVIVGAPHRRFDPATISSTLATVGLSVTSVAPAGHERTAPTFRVRFSDGSESYVVLLGRDQRDQDLMLRLWRSIRVKGFHDRRPLASPRRAAEHEQLTLALATAANVSTARPIAIGLTDDEAAIVATSWVDGHSVGHTPPEELSDALLTSIWQEVSRLHHRRIAHRWLNVDSVLIADGVPTLIGFRWASTNADDQMLGADVAELLCSLAVKVGVDRAVASAKAGLTFEELSLALPLMQPLVVSSETSAAMKANDLTMAAVRDAVQHALDVEKVELAPLSRVSLKGVVSLVGSIVLAFYVFTLAADWRSIVDAFGAMNWAAVPILVVMVLASNSGGALTLMGSVNVDLPFIRTSQIMFAQGFLNRFTPANAGGMALRARYLQRQGVEITVGAAAVGLTSAASGAVQAVLIVVFLVWGGASNELSRFQTPSITKVLGIIIVVGAVAGALLLSAWGKRVVLPKAKAALGPAIENFAQLARQPSKLALLFGGNLLSKMMTIGAFAVVVSAMGVDMSFARIGALYMIANTIGAAVPTPGGVGGLEAALTAALISAGVDAPTAGAIVLMFRLFTFWFPTIPGWACLQRAQRTGIV